MSSSVQVLAILQARTSSSRLPGKVLSDLAGKPMIMRQIERIRRSRLLDGLVVATSLDGSDDDLASVVTASGTALFRGSLDDVLDRYANALVEYPAQHVVRLTGDCPLTDPGLIDAVIAHHLVNAADITSNSNQPSFPDGLDVEIVRADCLHAAAAEASFKFEREHVTQFFYRRPDRFRIVHYRAEKDMSALRWTVDEPSDLAFVRAVYASLYSANPSFGFRHVLELLHAHPELSALNSGIVRNEGLARSLREEFGTQAGGH